MVLCGGRGERLAPLTDWRPKPLLPVADGSALAEIVEALRRAGCRQALVGAHHRAEQVREAAASLDRPGLRVSAAVTTRLRGPVGDAITVAAGLSDRYRLVVVVNGDTVSSTDFARLFQAHGKGAGLTLLAGQVDDGSRFGVLTVDAAGRLQAMVEKPKGMRDALVSVGTWVADRDVLDRAAHDLLTGDSADFAADLWPWAQRHGVPVGVEVLAAPRRWLDMGAMETLYDTCLGHADAAPTLISPGTRVFVGAGASIPGDVTFSGRVYLEAGSSVAKGVRLHEAVVLRGGTIDQDVFFGLSDGRSYPTTDERLHMRPRAAGGEGS